MANLKDTSAKLVNTVHRNIFSASKGRVLGKVAGMTVVLLTTTGRKSGQRRTTMLTSPVYDNKKVVLVASYGGDDRDPTWFLNLKANPDVEVVMEGTRRSMVARVASDAERKELWPQVTAKYKGYAGYQEKTEREIPLVILEPAA